MRIAIIIKNTIFKVVFSEKKNNNQVLINIIKNYEFIILENKYFLANIGYSNSNYIIISY